MKKVLSPSNLKVYKYNSTWREDYVNISYNGIYMGRNIPAPTNSTTIGIGTFTFRTGNPYYNGFDLEYNYEGILSSNGKIITTDSIVGKNIRATSSVDSRYVTAIVGNFSGRVSGSEMSINGATISTTYPLAVNGGVLCEELKVMADVPSSDYVFEKEYELKTLSEVEKFVKENKHLPDVPSAQEFKENGYKVGEMDDMLLRKIEELTLYIIDLQKQIEELKQ